MGSRVEGRPVTDEADARVCLAAVSASGLTLFGWARDNGVFGQSLYRWRQVIAGRDGSGIADAGAARALLAAWTKSGRSMAAWCRAEHVSMEALSQWRRRLKPSSRAGRTPAQGSVPTKTRPLSSSIRLVEVAVASRLGERAEPVEEPVAARYAVCVGRCRVLLEGDFDDVVLARLLRVAAAC